MTVEGNAYFPASGATARPGAPSGHTSVCPWKGTAHYYSLEVDGKTNADAVWYYPGPETGGGRNPRPGGVLERRQVIP